ncbi:cation-transporting P-type ATPase [Erysipelothrix sp. D19-032]
MKETTYTNDTRRYVDATTASTEKIYTHYKSSPQGLTRLRVESNRKQYGENTISDHKETPTWMKFIQAFINPFTLILIGLACFSYITDIAMVSPGEEDPVTVIIILVMVTLSGLLRFIQEYRSSNEAKKLSELVETTTRVARKGHEPQELPLHEVVVGDLIILSAGDMIPTDMRIIESKDLFISQAALTGESEPVEKFSKDLEALDAQLTATQNLVFMGSNVISGSARGIVIATGDDTMFGEVSHSASAKRMKPLLRKA